MGKSDLSVVFLSSIPSRSEHSET